MSGKKKKAAILARVSSSGREAALSLETQAEECTRFAVSLGFQVDVECVHREIGSGATLDRAQLANLRRMASAGKLEALIVYRPDRLSRNPVDLLALLREFGEHGVEVHFVHGSADSTSQHRLVQFVLENPELRELRGMGIAALGGQNQPYGYDFDPVAKKRLVNEAEARVVERIFRLCAAGWSVYRIATTLNAAGVRSKTGGLWRVSALRRILSNTSYMGVDYYGNT